MLRANLWDFSHKTVLITGGTGTLGSQLVQALLDPARCKVGKVVIYSRDALKQSAMPEHTLLRKRLGCVRDLDRLKEVMRDVDYVIHAAALKQIDMIEYNPSEAVKTNIDGSDNVVHAAVACGVERVLCISTDKAVSPITAYGYTKAMMEKLAITGNAYARKSSRTGDPLTAIAVCRYGNVLGSRGSVLELFHKQVVQGKPITITNPEMRRFTMTVRQAVDFVLEHLQHFVPGSIAVPMLPVYNIVDFATAIVQNAGGKDLKESARYEICGIRAGNEKLNETLLGKHELARTVCAQDKVLYVLPDNESMRNRAMDALHKIYTEEDVLPAELRFDDDYSTANAKVVLDVEQLRLLLRGDEYVRAVLCIKQTI